MEALHLRQTVRFFGVKRSCERRLPVREFDCFRLGTAMTASTNLCLISFGGPRGTPLSQGTFFPETPGFRILARPVRSQPVLIADSSDPSRKTWQSPGLPSHPKNFKARSPKAFVPQPFVWCLPDWMLGRCQVRPDRDSIHTTIKQSLKQSLATR
jgi:hypothetical protein